MAALLATSFLLLAVIGRVILQVYQTGNHGLRFANPKTQPVAALAGACFLLSFAIGIGIVALDFIDIWPIQRFAPSPVPAIATVIGLLGIGVVVTAQWQMHDAWRIGVDPSEKTKLITRGLFTRSRNPIYFGILLFWVGLSGALSHPLIWTMALICWICIEIIVRQVEEPYLRKLHGNAFDQYAAKTNRYLLW